MMEAGSAEKQAVTPIMASLQQLEGLVKEMEEAVGRVEGRLGAVLAPDPAVGGANQPASTFDRLRGAPPGEFVMADVPQPGGSELMCRLEVIREGFAAQIQRLEGLMGRVEL